MATPGLLLVDANVLVDYQAASLSILTLVSMHVGTVHIVSTVLAEVDGLDVSKCEGLGFRVVEPTLDQVTEASTTKGRLSFQDRTCLVVCRDNGWICVSNDKALRKSCDTAGVAVRWGLELMVDLVHTERFEPMVLTRYKRINAMLALLFAGLFYAAAAVLVVWRRRQAPGMKRSTGDA